MIGLLLLLGMADPWSRPAHLRAVSEPPTRWAALDARRPVRLWWDDEREVDVQVRVHGRWRMAAEDVRPGWTDRPRPADSEWRVRWSDDGRWTEPVLPVPWWAPSDLARLSGPEDAVLASVVGQVAPASGGAWISTLGGGAAWLESVGGHPAVHSLTRWDGLPDDRVIALDAREGALLVGTARGAAWLQDGVVERVVDEALPDPYVQAVLLGEGERAWVGTYHGLARVQGAQVDTVLEPWSVFSLAQAREGGVWAGYEGLKSLQGETAEDVPAVAERHVYALQDGAAGLLVATEEAGLSRVDEAGLSPVEGYPTRDAYGIAQNLEGLWVAAGSRGLVGPGGASWGRRQGLPSDTSWTVAAGDDGALWIGTARGPAMMRPAPGAVGMGARSSLPRPVMVFPTARWPAATEVQDLLPLRGGAWVAGPRGVWTVGRPSPHADDLVVAAGEGIVALVQDDGATWAIGRRAVRLDRHGALSQIELPITPSDAVAWAGDVWIGGQDGLWRLSQGRFRAVLTLPGIRRLVPGRLALWVVARGAVFQVIAGGAKPFVRTGTALDVAPGPEGVWVGTRDGLELLLPESGDVVDVLGDADGGVAIPAVASDGAGGCWFAGEDGTVGRVGVDGQPTLVQIGQPDAAWPNRIVPEGPDTAWVLTTAGAWRVRLARDD